MKFYFLGFKPHAVVKKATIYNTSFRAVILTSLDSILLAFNYKVNMQKNPTKFELYGFETKQYWNIFFFKRLD